MRWNPSLHPRDTRGRFARTRGPRVRVPFHQVAARVAGVETTREVSVFGTVAPGTELTASRAGLRARNVAGAVGAEGSIGALAGRGKRAVGVRASARVEIGRGRKVEARLADSRRKRTNLTDTLAGSGVARTYSKRQGIRR